MIRARYMQRGALAIDAAQWGLEFTIADPEPAPFKEIGPLAVVTIDGPLVAKTDRHCPFDSYEAIQTRFAAALASGAETVVLRINSPGGEVSGCFELAAWMRAQAQAAGKHVCAFADGQAASAAYALACSADEIYLPPTAGVGSIGCIKVVADQTAMDRAMGLNFAVVASGARKADGNPHTPLTEAMIKTFQEEIDEMAALFYGLVADARGLSTDSVESMQGAQFLGKGAVTAGLANQVLTWDELVDRAVNGSLSVGDAMGMKYEEAVTGLMKLAEGEDDNAKKARRMLKAAFDDGDGDEKKDEKKDEGKKAESEEKKDDAKAESEEKKDDAKAESDDEAKAKALANDPGLKALALVQDLSAKLAARDEDAERAALLASRQDFAPEVVKALTAKDKDGKYVQPISAVRFAVETFPKAKLPGQVGAAIAALGAGTKVRGEGQGEGEQPVNTDAQSGGYDLDVAMGLKQAKNPIRKEGNILALGVMTPAQARAEIARREKENA